MQNYLLILLVLASKALATPIDLSPNEVVARDVSILEGEESILEVNAVESIASLQFSGPITPGGPDVKLFGSNAKDVYEQILKLNPAYDVFAFPTYAAGLKAQGVTRENIRQTGAFSPNAVVAARNQLERRDSFNCNIGKTVGNFNTNCAEGLYYLRVLGQALCSAPAKSCSRVSCSNNCGMYLCSKMDKQKQVHCTSIANDMVKIANNCGFLWVAGVLSARGRMQFDSHNTELSSVTC